MVCSCCCTCCCRALRSAAVWPGSSALFRYASNCAWVASCCSGACQISSDSRRALVSRRFSTLPRSEEHTSELRSRENLVCRLLLEKKKAGHVLESICHKER